MLTYEENEKRFGGNADEYSISIDNQTDNIEDIIKQKEEEDHTNDYKKYIPLGSVVTIEDNPSKMKIIVGYKYQYNGTEYDYIAFDYPFGIDNTHSSSLFNHNQIIRFYHIGYSDEYSKEYRANLNDNLKL